MFYSLRPSCSPHITLKGADELQPETSAVLGDSVHQRLMLFSPRIFIFLVKDVVETGGKLDPLNDVPAEKRQVENGKTARVFILKGLSLAHILDFQSGKKF